MKRWIARIFLTALTLFIFYNGWVFGHVIYWRSYDPESSAFMRQRLTVLRQDNPEATLRHQWVPYNKISNNLKRAIIASEDAKFVDHEGFDWDGIEAAYEKNLKKGKISAGGSTISQQLAKNLFLSSSRTPWRKGEEALITVMIEKTMSKQRILEIYMNMIEWGNGVFGAEAASQYYFGISASALTKNQAAKLAAMIPNPRFYDKNRNAPGLAKKTRIIARRMNMTDLP